MFITRLSNLLNRCRKSFVSSLDKKTPEKTVLLVDADVRPILGEPDWRHQCGCTKLLSVELEQHRETTDHSQRLYLCLRTLEDQRSESLQNLEPHPNSTCHHFNLYSNLFKTFSVILPEKKDQQIYNAGCHMTSSLGGGNYKCLFSHFCIGTVKSELFMSLHTK